MNFRFFVAGAALALLAPSARTATVLDEVAPIFTRVDGTVIVPA